MCGPRSTAPCVACDRWHRAWPLREILGAFLTINMEKINIKGAGGRVTVVGCSWLGGFWCPWSVVCWAASGVRRCLRAIDGTVRGPRAVTDCSARSLRRFLPKLIKTSLWAVFAAYRVFERRFALCWPMFADLSGVKRRCALCLLKLGFRLRETQHRIQQIDTSRTICYILLF